MLPGILHALLVCVLFTLHAPAAETLRAEVRPGAVRPRGQAPQMVEVTLTSFSARLLEGPLEFTLTDGDTTLCRYRTHELALSPGAQSFRFMLPLGTNREMNFGAEAELRFLAKRGAIELGKFPIESRLNAERVLTIAVSKPRLAGPQREFSWWQSLRLDRVQSGERDSSPFPTAPIFLETEDFPTSPLAFCAYDIVLLDGDGFTLLREKHLAALARWVRGGGSLCVRAGETMRTEHRQFLTDLLAADRRAPSVEIDHAARLILPGEEGLLFARPGLGRLVLTTLSLDDEEDFTRPVWSKAAKFLWKFRAAQAERVLKSGAWQNVWSSGNGAEYARELEGLSKLLMPSSVRLVPFGWIIAILAGFIIVIGPLDWCVLGRLKMRRYTWVFFPCVSAAFTLFTVWLADRYMGAQSHRSSLLVTDLGDDGSVLRETRFELIFPAKNQEVTTEVRNALSVSMGTTARSSRRDDRPLPDLFEGQFPARYHLRQQLRQWTPQVNRITTFEPSGEAVKFAWERVPALLAQPAGVVSEAEDAVFAVTAKQSPRLLAASPAGAAFAPLNLIQQLCAGAPTPSGLASVVEQLSPNGAGNFDDLLLPAAHDPARLVIVVARRENSGLHLFRRSFDR